MVVGPVDGLSNRAGGEQSERGQQQSELPHRTPPIGTGPNSPARTDSVGKPFEVEELSARVRALLRRTQPPPAERLAFADVVLDPETGSARRGGSELELTRREAELLELLLRNARGVVSRELALERVWGGEDVATPNAVDRYVAYLRRKLGEPPLIHTVRGVGFRLDRA